MRGTTAKRLRKLAKRELLKWAIEHQVKDPQLLLRQLAVQYKALKSAWRMQSKPKSLAFVSNTTPASSE